MPMARSKLIPASRQLLAVILASMFVLPPCSAATVKAPVTLPAAPSPEGSTSAPGPAMVSKKIPDVILPQGLGGFGGGYGGQTVPGGGLGGYNGGYPGDGGFFGGGCCGLNNGFGTFGYDNGPLFFNSAPAALTGRFFRLRSSMAPLMVALAAAMLYF